MTRALMTTALLLFAATAGAQADHLQCFKIKDATTKAIYTATLTPTDNTFPVAPGCLVKVPAKLLCVDVVKTITAGNPPGAGPGNPAQKYLCYKVKCPKASPTATIQDQFGTHQVTVKGTSLLCAPEPAPTTTTTSSTTTTTAACTPTPEVCDGIDNDCNGMVDDGLGQTTCGTGACQVTVQNCVMGMPQMCSPGMPHMEICGNMIDDDCDGMVDEQPCICQTNSQCPGAPNATGLCQGGNCTIQCQSGYLNCNANNADGCEIYVNGDPFNCGSCGHVCNSANGTVTCNAGNCQIVQCNTGFADCNGMPNDGCETNLYTNPNCGGCGIQCPPSNPTCMPPGVCQ